MSQRMHDAVRDAAKLMLASGELPSQAGVPATLLITATLDDLERKTGHVSTAHGGLLPIRDVLPPRGERPAGAGGVRHRR